MSVQSKNNGVPAPAPGLRTTISGKQRLPNLMDQVFWLREQHTAGRTGMFMAYYLCQAEQLTPAAAIAEVKRVRPIAFSAEGWHVFTLEVLEHFAN